MVAPDMISSVKVIKYYRMMYAVLNSNDEKSNKICIHFCNFMGWKKDEDRKNCVKQILQEQGDPSEIINEYEFEDSDTELELADDFEYLVFMQSLIKLLNDPYSNEKTECMIADVYYKIYLLYERDKTKALFIESKKTHDAARDRINQFIVHPYVKMHSNWSTIFRDHLENINRLSNDILLI